MRIGECRKTASSHSRVLANSREDVSLSLSLSLCLRLYLSVEIASTLLPERFRVAAATRTVIVDPTARKSRHCRRSNYQIVRHFSLERLRSVSTMVVEATPNDVYAEERE